MESYDISDLYRVISRDSGGSQNKFYRNGVWYKQDTIGEEAVAESAVSLVLANSNISNFRIRAFLK